MVTGKKSTLRFLEMLMGLFPFLPGSTQMFLHILQHPRGSGDGEEQYLSSAPLTLFYKHAIKSMSQ